MLGATFMLPPIINGSFSKRLSNKNQGIGLGVLHSIKGITFCLSPIIFANLYGRLRGNGFLVTMPFMVIAIFIIIGFVILCGPLRRVVNEHDHEMMKLHAGKVQPVHNPTDQN